jgi:hypothetical protein
MSMKLVYQCSLCAFEAEMRIDRCRVGSKQTLPLPEGWKAYKGNERVNAIWTDAHERHFCSAEHELAYKRAEREAMKVGADAFLKVLRTAQHEAMGAVDGLASVAEPDRLPHVPQPDYVPKGRDPLFNFVQGTPNLPPDFESTPDDDIDLPF